MEDTKQFLKAQWDRIGAWAAIALGCVLLLLGWLGVSDQLVPAGQLPYLISGGIGGACLIGIGAMLWLSADLRDQWTALRELADKLDDNVDGNVEPPAEGQT